MEEEFKVCKVCKKKRPISRFYKVRGYYWRTCRTCKSKAEKVRYQTDPKFRAKQILSYKKNRCKNLGIPFDLDLDWLYGKMQFGRCEATGLELQLDMDEDLGHPLPFAPSIDRIDREGGYLKDNCRVVCHIFNMAKNAYTDDELYIMCRAFIDRYEYARRKKAA